MKRILDRMGAVILAALAFLFEPLRRYYERAFCLSLTPQNYPTVQQFAQYAAQQWNLTEIIYQPLYHYLPYPTAGLVSLKFFGTAIGQGVNSASPGNAGNALALSDTNMQGGGQLPAPQAFFCRGIQVVVDPGSSAATTTTFALQIPTVFAAANAAAVQSGEHDVNAILSTGALTWTISSKPYFQMAPLAAMPPSFSLALDAAIATTSATAGEVSKAKLRSVGRLLTLEPGIGIGTSQNFDVTLSWPVAVATPSTFNARVGVILDGWQFRAAQ